MFFWGHQPSGGRLFAFIRGSCGQTPTVWHQTIWYDMVPYGYVMSYATYTHALDMVHISVLEVKTNFHEFNIIGMSFGIISVVWGGAKHWKNNVFSRWSKNHIIIFPGQFVSPVMMRISTLLKRVRLMHKYCFSKQSITVAVFTRCCGDLITSVDSERTRGTNNQFDNEQRRNFFPLYSLPILLEAGTNVFRFATTWSTNTNVTRDAKRTSGTLKFSQQSY